MTKEDKIEYEIIKNTLIELNMKLQEVNENRKNQRKINRSIDKKLKSLNDKVKILDFRNGIGRIINYDN